MHIHSRIGLAKPAPHRMARGAARVVVHSIGNSGVSLVRSLCRLVPLPEPDITALLFQAPSALLTGLDRSTADMIVGSLRETGLDCAVLEDDADIEEGVGDHEVALDVHDFTRMAAVVREVMCVLGLDERSARQLVCAMPSVLLSGVSSATVNALRARFAPLGAGIDASCPETACFDVYLGNCAPSLRARALARLQAVSGASGSVEPEAGVLSGVDGNVVQRVNLELRHLAVPWRVVNRDFARYTLILQQGVDTTELRCALMHLMGMSESSIPHLLRNLPVTLQSRLPHAETARALAALQAAGARASAEPSAFEWFSLALDPVREPAALLPTLCALGEIKESDALDILRSPDRRFPGPFTGTQVRWLAHELRRAGAGVHIDLEGTVRTVPSSPKAIGDCLSTDSFRLREPPKLDWALPRGSD